MSRLTTWVLKGNISEQGSRGWEISYLDLCTIFHFAFLWDGICDYNSFQITFLNSPQSRTREDSMCQYSINFGSTSISQS
ncbi:hypothetical protein pdam_00013063, partial [Pocillopora damicornis]